MEAEKFENILLGMTKPEVSELKHESMLADVIIKAKDRSALSWWWLSIPLYIIAAFCMKSFFMPQATLISSIHEFSSKEKYLSLVIFVFVPVVFIILNFLSVRKVLALSGSSDRSKFLQEVWFNCLMILLCVIILITYFI
jgi:hypothetical protein